MALPKRHRLRGHRAIDHLHRHGQRHHSTHLLLRVVPAEASLLAEPDRRAPPSAWRCALVISAKVHKRAVVRNRLRRLLHRHLLASLRLPAEPLASAVRPSGAVASPGAVAPTPSELALHPVAVEPTTDVSQPVPAALAPPARTRAAMAGNDQPPPRRSHGSHGVGAPTAAAVPRDPASSRGRAPQGRKADRPTDDPAAAGSTPRSDPPLWLMVSLRPGSAELDADLLLGECSFLLRRAGLIR